MTRDILTLNLHHLQRKALNLCYLLPPASNGPWRLAWDIACGDGLKNSLVQALGDNREKGWPSSMRQLSKKTRMDESTLRAMRRNQPPNLKKLVAIGACLNVGHGDLMPDPCQTLARVVSEMLSIVNAAQKMQASPQRECPSFHGVFEDGRYELENSDVEVFIRYALATCPPSPDAPEVLLDETVLQELRPSGDIEMKSVGLAVLRVSAVVGFALQELLPNVRLSHARKGKIR